MSEDSPPKQSKRPAWKKTNYADDLLHQDAATADVVSTSVPDESSSKVINSLDESSQVQLGKELAAIFKNHSIHPVFIFGSRGSGKTSFLASMFKYMRDREESEASIDLIEDVFPADNLHWRDSLAWSRDLFYKKVFAYMDSTVPPATQEGQPFFVPIKLTRLNGEEVNFAFLEGKGEWYMPDYSADVPFKAFKGFLQGMLQHFNGPATVLYVGPYVTEASDESQKAQDLRDSDKGLLGALKQYKEQRKAYFHQDHHMFIVTKWDVYCESLASESFSDPDEDEIKNVARARFPLTWAQFMNVNMSSEIQNRSISTFCAGIIQGQNVVMPAEQDVHAIDFYPRKIWDYLYQNVTGGVLYSDVRPTPQGFLDRILNMLRG
jgi:hypothetical protein